MRIVLHVEPWRPLIDALGDHSKAATYDRFKTGHFAGLRHTL
jgi:hypothetical protein